jgi:hypothetical protein
VVFICDRRYDILNLLIGSLIPSNRFLNISLRAPDIFFKIWTLMSLSSSYYTNLPKETRGFICDRRYDTLNLVIGSLIPSNRFLNISLWAPDIFSKIWTLISISSSNYTNLPKETRGFHLWPEIWHFELINLVTYTVKSIFEHNSSGPGYFFQNLDSYVVELIVLH